MLRFTMLIGLPGSGKSTWLKSTNLENTVILSTDNYIETVAEEMGKTYNDIFMATIKDATGYLNIDLENAIRDKKNIIWDQTNLNAKTRKKKLSRIPKSYAKEAIIFNPNFSIVDKVNVERRTFGRALPIGILDSMKQNFDVSSISNEGFGLVTEIFRKK